MCKFIWYGLGMVNCKSFESFLLSLSYIPNFYLSFKGKILNQNNQVPTYLSNLVNLSLGLHRILQLIVHILGDFLR